MKILKRTILIFLIGMGIGWFSRFCYYWTSPTEGIGFGAQLWEAAWTFDRIRILGVMQRLALCYGATAIIALTMKHRNIPYLIATLLTGYFILLICGNGFAYNDTNILSVVDRAILTPAHMYKDNGIDPEGLLSTIPAIAHVLLGFCVGRMMLEGGKADESRESMLNSHLIKLFLAGHPYIRRLPAELRMPHQQENMVAYLRTGYLRIGFQLPGAAHLDYRCERL